MHSNFSGLWHRLHTIHDTRRKKRAKWACLRTLKNKVRVSSHSENWWIETSVTFWRSLHLFCDRFWWRHHLHLQIILQIAIWNCPSFFSSQNQKKQPASPAAKISYLLFQWEAEFFVQKVKLVYRSRKCPSWKGRNSCGCLEFVSTASQWLATDEFLGMGVIIAEDSDSAIQ